MSISYSWEGKGKLQYQSANYPMSDLSSARRLSARVCKCPSRLNTVVVVFFSRDLYSLLTHGRHGGVEPQLRNGDGSWPKRHTSQARF